MAQNHDRMIATVLILVLQACNNLVEFAKKKDDWKLELVRYFYFVQKDIFRK